MSSVLARNIELTPKVILLGILFVAIPTNPRSPTSVTAKHDIAKQWTAERPPSLVEWRAGMDWQPRLRRPYACHEVAKTNTFGENGGNTLDFPVNNLRLQPGVGARVTVIVLVLPDIYF